MNIYIQYAFIALVVAFAIFYVGRLIKNTVSKDKNCGSGDCGCKK